MKLHNNIKELLENRREKLKEILVDYEARMLQSLERTERVREEINQLSKILGEKEYRKSCVDKGGSFGSVFREIWEKDANEKDKFFKSVVIIVPEGSIITPPKEK